MTVFTVTLLPLLIWLAFWQLDREKEKIELQRNYDNRMAAAPQPITEVDWGSEDLAFLKVDAQGRYDNQKTLLLDNRVHEGRVGYELLSPFVTDSGDILLVNRGWIAQGVSRDELPSITPVVGVVQITGIIYVPLEEAFLLGEEQEVGQFEWPRVIQSIRMESASSQLGLSLKPYTVRLESGAPGLEQPNWQTVNMLPEKHRGYAVQWFTMAVALFALYIFFGFKHPELSKTESQDEQ